MSLNEKRNRVVTVLRRLFTVWVAVILLTASVLVLRTKVAQNYLTDIKSKFWQFVKEQTPKQEEKTFIDDSLVQKVKKEQPQTDIGFENIFAEVVKKVKDGVVTIAIRSYGLRPGEGIVKVEENIGSGFIVDKEAGIIVTNRHVVSRDAQYVVITSSGEAVNVKKILRDPTNDIALIIVDDPSKLPIELELADSDSLSLGEWVLAFGTPLGKFPGTVSVGIVSGLGRSIDVDGIKYENIIQTDAAVNPGNSGGPLVNLKGQVVGINFVKVIGADNISFALPINLVKSRLAEYKQFGRFRVPFLGIRYIMLDYAYARYYGAVAGAYVVDVVSGSPAEKAGIQPDDIIVKIEDESVAEYGLRSLLNRYKVGDTINVKVKRRKGNTYQDLTFEVRLVDRAEFLETNR